TFLGEANVLKGTVGQPRTVVNCGEIVFELDQPVPGAAGAGWICLRPEHIEIAPRDASATAGNGVPAEVTAATFIGPTVRYTVSAGENTLHVEAPAQREVGALFPGDAVTLRWPRSAPVFVADDGSAVPKT